MKAYRLAAAGLALGLLTGCASLLERSYTTSEPHSSKFWESEAAATLRAENRQDMVNDLLILIGQHTETASLRLYNFPDEQTALEELEHDKRLSDGRSAHIQPLSRLLRADDRSWLEFDINDFASQNRINLFPNAVCSDGILPPFTHDFLFLCCSIVFLS